MILLPTSEAVENLHTADQIATARLTLMDWREKVEHYGPGDPLWDVLRERIAAAITARAIALGLESV